MALLPLNNNDFLGATAQTLSCRLEVSVSRPRGRTALDDETDVLSYFPRTRRTLPPLSSHHSFSSSWAYRTYRTFPSLNSTLSSISSLFSAKRRRGFLPKPLHLLRLQLLCWRNTYLNPSSVFRTTPRSCTNNLHHPRRGLNSRTNSDTPRRRRRRRRRRRLRSTPRTFFYLDLRTLDTPPT